MKKAFFLVASLCCIAVVYGADPVKTTYSEKCPTGDITTNTNENGEVVTRNYSQKTNVVTRVVRDDNSVTETRTPAYTPHGGSDHTFGRNDSKVTNNRNPQPKEISVECITKE